MSLVDPQLDALTSLNLAQLRAAWPARYGSPPSTRSPELLRLMLGWRLQAAGYGGLDVASRRQLERTGPLECEGRALGAGARLTRQWQGQRVDVVVTNDGFEWNGTSYKSLSSVATAIAGSRWNGPRFFGLRKAALDRRHAEDRASMVRARHGMKHADNRGNNTINGEGRT